MGNTLYRSAAGATALADLYAQQLAAWPVEYEALRVPTTAGETHVLVAGDAGGPPLLLLHDWGAGAASLYLHYNIEALATRYLLVMPDIPGQPGRSASSAPPTSTAYGAWARETLDALGVRETFVAGSAGGGDVALRLAAHAPFHVIRALVAAPGGLAAPVQASVRLRVAALALRLRPNRANARRAVRALTPAWRATTPALEHHARQVALAAAHLTRFQPPPVLTDDELARIRAPLRLLVGGGDPTLRAQAVAERAENHILNAEVDLLPEHAHLLSLESPGHIERQMLQFFGQLG